MFTGITITTAIFILFPLTLHLTAAGPYVDDDYAVLSCKAVVSADRTYASDLKSLLASLSATLAPTGFAKSTAGSTPSSTIYGLALCRGDAPTEACVDCFSRARYTLLKNCSGTREAIVWQECCMLRYADRDIFWTMETDPAFTSLNDEDTVTRADWKQALTATMSNVTQTAAADVKKFATTAYMALGTNQTIYSLAQCTPDLTAGDCSNCFTAAIDKLPVQNQAGFVLLPSCILRYQLDPFNNNSSAPAPAQVHPHMPAPPPDQHGHGPHMHDVHAPAPTPVAIAGGGTAGKSPSSHSRVVKSAGITAGAVAVILVALGAGGWYYKRNFNPRNLPFNGSQDIDMKGNARDESFQMESNPVSAVPNSAPHTELPLDSGDIGNQGAESFQMDSNQLNQASPAIPNSGLGKPPLDSCQDIGNSKAESFHIDSKPQVSSDLSNSTPDMELGEGETEEGKLEVEDEDEEKEDEEEEDEDEEKEEEEEEEEKKDEEKEKEKKRRSRKKVKTKVAIATNIQHRNVVKLHFSEKDKKFHVYDGVPDLRLDKVLFDPIKRASLDWGKRFNIICGIAKGLLYLHHDSRMRIVHGNLKPSNILLEEDMNPQISNFGMAKMLKDDHTRASIDKQAAPSTFEYMAPECKHNGQYSFKSDIYSFGIIVLEIVTGQRNHARPLPEESMLHRIRRLWSEKKKLETIDSELKDYSIEEVGKCIDIGLLCIQEDAEERPTMTSIEAILIGMGKSTDLPVHLTTQLAQAAAKLSTTTATYSFHNSALVNLQVKASAGKRASKLNDKEKQKGRDTEKLNSFTLNHNKSSSDAPS